ncbi:MAG: anti-sigma B factor antagonist [Colwellia sp.]|jgi:anti-sigma B factor antagonist
MLNKLEPINGISIYSYTRVALVEKILQLLTRLSINLLSFFYKGNSIELTEVSDNTQHLQYEIIHLVGEININNSALMKRELLKVISQQKSIILDFTKLNFIDSSGIATLIESFNITTASDLKLAIVGANDLPLKMLELTQLDKVFTLFDAIQDIKV